MDNHRINPTFKRPLRPAEVHRIRGVWVEDFQITKTQLISSNKREEAE